MKKINQSYLVGFGKSNFAFTLIETLLVISIITLLSSLILPNLNLVRNKALVTVAKENLRQLENSLALFEFDHGYYPGQPGRTESNQDVGGWSPAPGGLQASLVPKYISKLPDNPQITYSYKLESCPGNQNQNQGCSFSLSAYLGSGNNHRNNEEIDDKIGGVVVSNEDRRPDLGKFDIPSIEEEVKDEVIKIAKENEECFDGLDNNEDGKIDFDDFGCFGPNGQETDADYGWTTFIPHPTTRIVYVSSSEGNDSNNGLSPSKPVKTISKGLSLIRNNHPDWLLLRRGDTWGNADFIDRNGLSEEHMIVVSSYGENTERPKLVFSTNKGLRLWGVKNFALVGLEIYPQKRDPNSPKFLSSTSVSGGISILFKNENVLLEDNHLRYGGLNIQDYGGGWENVKVRRNVIAYSYSTDSHAQGIFTKGKGKLLIEENVLHHNGWNDDFRFEVIPGNSDPAAWASITDGHFQINLATSRITTSPFKISGVNFTGDTTMFDVAQTIEDAINVAVGKPGAVTFDWTGAVFVLKSDTFVSSDKYSLATLSGGEGTNISLDTWLNRSSLRKPESTIFNRNMYLSYGYGNTTLRGNIDSKGASGGVQLRMGGLIEDNLFLRNPISITVGHKQNPAKSTIGGMIRRNVILGARDIDTQAQGGGISAESTNTKSYGHNYFDGIYIYDNIIAHNELGTGNSKAISLGAASGSKNAHIYNNVVYNWRNNTGSATDHRGSGLDLYVPSDFTGGSVYSNWIIQPNKGFVISTSESSARKFNFYDNAYFSTSGHPGTWSSTWFRFGGSTIVPFTDWVNITGDTSTKLTAVPNFRDPKRDIDTYAGSLGFAPTYEAFMEEAMKQSRFNWRPELTAYAVNEYIREGFEIVNQ
ncbi:MAG: hypothetical protein WDZ85_03885 [Candidatus Paceibacterota bacterium]